MTSEYRNFDQVKTSELFITRHKWMFPYYELTDGQFVYGKMSYKGSFKRYAIIETAQGIWTIKRKGLFNRSLLLNRNEEETIGTITPEIWKRNVAIRLDNGFEAAYQYKKLFTRSFSLMSETLGDILHITQKPFGIKKPLTVTVEPIKQKFDVNIPLLIFVGVHIILLRQAQAAAAS